MRVPRTGEMGRGNPWPMPRGRAPGVLDLPWPAARDALDGFLAALRHRRELVAPAARATEARAIVYYTIP